MCFEIFLERTFLSNNALRIENCLKLIFLIESKK